MFQYSLKTKIIIFLVFLFMMAGIVVLVYFNFSRARDLRVVSEAKVLATALEKYYDKYQAYPQTTKISLGQIAMISDAGINAEGDVVYFRRTDDIADSATLASDGKNYAIAFDVQNSWRAWGVTSWRGGSCRLISNVVLQCK